MHWNKPSFSQPAADTEDAQRVAASPELPRLKSDVYEPEPVDERPWYPAVRVAGLLLPSSWVWLSVCVWWTWRLLALYAAGATEGRSLASADLAWALLADLVLVQATFAAARTVVALSSSRREPRHAVGLWTARAAFVAFALSGVVRIVELVHGAVEKSLPGLAFWRQLVAVPGDYLLQGGAFAVVVVALACAALARYCLGCDLEVAQTLAGRQNPRRALALTVGSAAAYALGAVLLVQGAAAGTAPATTAWDRLPEVEAVRHLLAVEVERERAATPELEP